MTIHTEKNLTFYPILLISYFGRIHRLTACLFILMAGVVHANERPVEYDAYGNAVFTKDGNEIFYTKEELSVARTPVASIAPATLSETSGDLGLSLASIQEAFPISLELVWRHSVWGSNLGESGITAVDLEGDGTTEIVLGTTLARNFGQNKNWHVVRHNPTTGGYDIVFTSNDNPYWSVDQTEINTVNVFKLAGKQKILIGYSSGKLSVFDGPTLSSIREINVSTQPILSVAFADGDNDGSDEIMVSTQGRTYLYNPLTFAKESDFPVGGREMSVGNVDNDPELEIVFVEGQVIEYDGVLFAEEWDFSEFTSGRWLELGDLDGDGIQELVVARAWYYIDILDARNRTPLRQITTSNDISQLKLADVTDDSKPEILYGDQQHNYVHAINGVSLVELWRLNNLSSGVPGIEVADVDDDGELEVIWGSGSNTTGPDFLSVHSISTLARKFVSFDEGGPFRALTMGNADDDSADEFVFAASEGDRVNGNSYTSNTPIHVISSLDFALEWNTFDLTIGGGYYGYLDLAIGNVDGGIRNEIVLTGEYSNGVSVIDGVTRTLKNKRSIGSADVLSIGLADFGGDGKDEVVGTMQNQLHIIDGTTLNATWSSIVLTGGSAASSIDTSDLSGDGVPDLVASIGRILIIDGATKVYRQTAESDYRGFAIAEDAQGNKQIWAGTSGGLLVELNPSTLAREPLDSICSGAVNSVKASDSEAFAGSIQFACDDTIGIWGLPESQVIWRSPVLGNQVGLSNNLFATQQGNKAVLMVGTGYGVYAFRGFEISNRDIDDDGVLNQFDNCRQESNPNQEDLDQDGSGDACNNTDDSDGDEWSGALDNCPWIPNPGQEDHNNNGRGDVCDSLPPGC